jgi:predicted transcriptional regulator of viral defense system
VCMNRDAALARLAARQYGLFTIQQATRLGMTGNMLTRRVRDGLIERREPGVYAFTSVPPSWHQSVLAAAWAEKGFASLRTAAALWQFDGCRPGIIEISTERWHRRPNRSVRVHETRRLPPDDTAEVDGIPVTTRARTIVDLAAVVPAERVEEAMDGALNRREVAAEAIWECIERLENPGRPWVTVVRRLVAPKLGIATVLPNVFERRLLEVLRSGGAPLPEAQVEIREPDGAFVARVDWLFPKQRVVIECDSEEWHGGWRRRKADMRRDRRLAALGYIVLHVSWEDLVLHPEQVVADVLGALARVPA